MERKPAPSCTVIQAVDCGVAARLGEGVAVDAETRSSQNLTLPYLVSMAAYWAQKSPSSSLDAGGGRPLLASL